MSKKQPTQNSTETQGTSSPEPERVSAEYRWREFIETNRNLAYIRDTEQRPILYHWGDHNQESHWVHIGQQRLAEMADRFLSQTSKKSYKSATLNSCAAIVDKALPNMRRPLQQCKKTTRIATKNAVLFFHPGGRIEAREINRYGTYILAYDDGNDCRGMLFDAYVPVKIDFSRVVDGWYTPRPRKETEKGLFGRLVGNLFYDDEDLENFQEFFGDLFSKKQRKAIPIMVGPADSGKSQLLIILRRIITQHAMVDLTEMDGFNKETWVGKNVLIVDEGPTALGVKSESTIKRLVGGAGTTVQRKGEKSLHLDSSWKHIWAFNAMLKFVEKSEALRVRMRPFEIQKFRGSVVEEIGELICEQELDLAFDWALEGLVRVEQRGRVLRPDELSTRSRAILEQTREETNPVITWIRETELVPSSGKAMPTSDLYTLYTTWADERGLRFHAGISQAVFMRDYLVPAMEHLYPDTWTDARIRKVNKRTHNRENHIRVEFRNLRQAEMYESLHFDDTNVDQIPSTPLKVVSAKTPF